MNNIRTGLRQTISLKVFFAENSLDLIILITNSFLPTFLKGDKTYSLKRKSLSITTLKNFCFKLSQTFTSPIRAQIFNVYILKLIGGICLDLVWCGCFQTI